MQLDERRLDAGHLQAVGHLHHVVHDVVEFLGESVDVFTVKGRDERRVEAVEDLTGQLVTALFALDDATVTALDVVEVLEQLFEATGGIRNVLGCCAEQVEERVVGGDELETHERES